MTGAKIEFTKTEDGWYHYQSEFFTIALEFESKWIDTALIDGGAIPGSALADVTLIKTVRTMFIAAAHDLMNGRPLEDMNTGNMRVTWVKQ